MCVKRCQNSTTNPKLENEIGRTLGIWLKGSIGVYHFGPMQLNLWTLQHTTSVTKLHGTIRHIQSRTFWGLQQQPVLGPFKCRGEALKTLATFRIYAKEQVVLLKWAGGGLPNCIDIKMVWTCRPKFHFVPHVNPIKSDPHVWFHA